MSAETLPQLHIISKNTESVTLRKTVPGHYKLLLFTDMHLDGRADTCPRTLARMTDAILREKPDLVLLGGDNVTSALNKKRVNQLAQLFENLGVYWAAVLGNHEGDNPGSVSRREMIETLQIVCENSIYSYQKQICEGFITIKGGHRVGLVGSAVLKNDEIINLNYISGLNFRISREIYNCSDEIIEYILNIKRNSVYNTLIISPPGIGKTTLLRDIVR